MNRLPAPTRFFILITILTGLGLIAWALLSIEKLSFGLTLLALLGAVAQTLKVEGPNNRTNYNIAWFVYGFTFITSGPAPALLVILIAHLVEWAWHKYPWYIQSFNIGAHALPVYLAGMVFASISGGTRVLNGSGVIGLVAANLVFVSVNHFLVGVVVRLARGQSFSESGVFGVYTLLLDFTLLSMGAATALIWFYNPFASILNVLPLYLLYNAIRVPALKRQLEDKKAMTSPTKVEAPGD